MDKNKTVTSQFAIEVNNLSKVYGGKTVAVDGISFKVKRGEVYGFLGPNGAGKTTTLRVLATLLKPSSGQVKINGYELGQQDDLIRQTIGFSMQGITLDMTASALENLMLIGALYGASSKQTKARADELLALLNLQKVARSWVKNYSGGMKKRLDLAVALMHKPQLLFLDEPTEGLDPAARRKIWNHLKKFNT